MSKWNPGLSESQIERLDLLIEECSEVIKACSKIKRFGYFSTYGGSHPPNIEELQTEIGDVLALVQLLGTMGEVSPEEIHYAKQLKLIKMRPYTRFQEQAFKLLDEKESQA